jgi:hypothetical protein
MLLISFLEPRINADFSIFRVIFTCPVADIPSTAHISSFHSLAFVSCQSFTSEIPQIACFPPQCFNGYVPRKFHDQIHCVIIVDT